MDGVSEGSYILRIKKTPMARIRDVPLQHPNRPVYRIYIPYALEGVIETSPKLDDPGVGRLTGSLIHQRSD